MGLCACGCLQAAPVSTFTNRSRGYVRGEPMTYVHGHHLRGKRGPQAIQWKGDRASGRSVHSWLRANYAKAGICDLCGKRGKTDFAFKRHPAPYTRSRGDYLELCRLHHVRLDKQRREAA